MSVKPVLDEASIKKLAANLKVFMRGRNLFNAKERVGPLFFDAQNLLLSAKVSSFSDHVYDTFVQLRRNGSPLAASCSCNSFGKFKGCCKHVVALLLAAEKAELPDEGLQPPELPPGHPLRGVPLLRKELLTFEELLMIVGPGEDKQKKRRGRPPKKETAAETGGASASAARTGADEGLLIDRTVVKEPAGQTAENADGFVKIKPQLSGAEPPAEEVVPAFFPERLPALPPGKIFLNRLFNWEEREHNLLRTRDMQERDSEAARIELYLELNSGLANASRLFIKVGNSEHLYIVNQLGSFLRAYRERTSLSMGTYYTWEPPFKLDRAQQLFMDWLLRVWREEARFYHLRIREPFPDTKLLPLSGEHLAELLQLGLYCDGDLPIYLNYDGREFPLTLQKNLPADLQLMLCLPQAETNAEAEPSGPMSAEDSGGRNPAGRDKPGGSNGAGGSGKNRNAMGLGFCLNGREVTVKRLRDPELYGSLHAALVLLQEQGFVLYDDVIYLAENKQDRLLWHFMELLADLPEARLELNAAEASFFLSTAHEQLGEENRLFWEPGLKERLVELPLEIRNYVDVAEDTLWLSPFFFYGDYHFRPLLREALPQTKEGAKEGVLVVRDRHSELDFEHFLEEQGFREVSLQEHQLGLVTQEARGTYMANQFYLKGEEKIFRFLKYIFPAFRRIGPVYASQAFRQLSVQEPGEPSVFLDYDDAGGRIQIRISMEGYSAEEAALILRAYQQKQAFVRLTDGRFVDLGDENKRSTRYGRDLRDLVGTLSDWGAEWHDGSFSIPKYRGLALHGLLEERQIRPENADDPRLKAWDRLIEDMADPAKAAPALPPAVHAKLRPYQLLGYQWLCFLHRYDMGGILADEMGLGKTLQMLVFLWKIYLSEPGPLLVVAPTSLLYNWVAECRRFVPDLPCMVVEGTKPLRRQQYDEFAKQGGLLIVSYGLARQDRKELRTFDFACIVLDEAQNIKNPLTKTARAVKSLRGRRRFALTGTPLENHVGELWSIFDFLMPGYLFSYSVFQDRFAQAMGIKRQEAAEDSEQQEELRQVQESLHQLVSPFILRRLKQDVLKDLPDKIITDIPCAMTAEQQALYRQHLAYARRQITAFDEASGEERGRRRMDILGELTRLRQICCDPALFVSGYAGGSGKLEALEDLLNNLLESGHRILLFSQFTSMLAIIRERQEAAGRRVLYIDGQVPSKRRLELVSHFNAGDGEIFLISLKAGGTGLNLTGADVVVHYDPWWNPAVENQATDRAHRLGQRKVVQVFRMVTKGSIEEKIQEMQQRKQALLDDIVAPGATFINRMDLDDIRELFAE